MLVVPLAVLGGLLAEELAPSLDWAVLRRWWPAAAGALILVAYAALITTDWSQRQTSTWDRLSLVLALGGAVLLLTACYSLIERRAAAIVLVVVRTLAFALTHGPESVRGTTSGRMADARTSRGMISSMG
jgi:hypothetical protein